MAHKKQRGSSWWYVVKRKILPRPITLTFSSEAEGDEYVRRLEALLDRGIIPPEFAEKMVIRNTVGDLLRDYHAAVALADSDKPIVNLLIEEVGSVKLSEIGHDWVDGWITKMKQEQALSPSTLRKRVGSLARCFDWGGRKGIKELASNPLRNLPKRYSTYTATDSAALKVVGKEAKEDEVRDRRLQPGEENRIRAILAGEKPDDKQRPPTLKYRAALELIFDLALESAMRMREMFTLQLDQIDIDQATIWLDKTKNGDKRQVPLSSVARAAITRYLNQVKNGEHGMEGFDHAGSMLLPWYNPAASNPSREANRISAQLSAQFGRVFDLAGCFDLRFHDLRHEATSRLYERTNLSDLEIAKITGHKDPRMLMRYANLRASTLAARLW